MAKRVTIGLLGSGMMAGIHVGALRNGGTAGLGVEVELVAVSRDAERARAAAARFELQRHAAPYEAALADPTIDAVMILTPHDQHITLAAEAIRRGKHVFIEKPVAPTTACAEPLARAMKEHTGPAVMVGENCCHAPALIAAMQTIESGAIGKVHSVVANGLHCVRPGGWRTHIGAMGGGALIDGGVHVIHGLRRLAGEVAAVFAVEPARKTCELDGEEAMQLVMVLESGATATLNYSWAPHGDPPVPDYLVLGTRGSLAVNLRGKANELHPLADKAGEAPKPKKLPTQGRFGNVDLLDRLGHIATLRAWLEAITGVRPAQPDLIEGLRDLAVVEAAYRSLAGRGQERVQPPPEWARAAVRAGGGERGDGER